MTKEIIDVLLETFPRLYYGAPVMEKHQIKSGDGESPCSEHGDCILWLIGSLAHNDNDSQELGEIEDIFCRKYDISPPSTTFRTRIKAFKDAHLIDMIDDTFDERKWRVKLTEKGKEKLKHIRLQRLDLLTPIISLLEQAPPEESQIVLKYISLIGEMFWANARAESIARAREIQRKKRRRRRREAKTT